jgi:hypothetical protein
MTQPNNQSSIDGVMFQGASVIVRLKSDKELSGAFNGFLPTKDDTFICLVSSNLEQSLNTLIPMTNVAYIIFPTKLSSLL